MRINKVLETLREKEAENLKQGYRGDASQYAFFRYTLMLLTDIANSLKKQKTKKRRKPTNWNLFAGEYLRQGKTIQEAAKDWKKKKPV